MRLSRLLFTNIPVEELEEDTESLFSAFEDSEVCHLCRKGFSITEKKYKCKNCKMPVCISHSIFHDSKARICDNCTHESLVDEVWSEKKHLKDQIIKNIQRSVKDAMEKEENNKNEDEKIEKLLISLEDIKKKVEIEENLLQEEIEKIMLENNLTEKNIEKIMRESKEKQRIEVDTVEKMAKAHESLQILKIELEEAIQESQDLNNDYEKLKECRVSFDIIEIQEKLCKICRMKVCGNKANISSAGDLSRNVCACVAF